MGLYSQRNVCSFLKSDERLFGDKPSIKTIKEKSFSASIAFSHTHAHMHTAQWAVAVGLVPSELSVVDVAEGLSRDSTDTTPLLTLCLPMLFCSQQISVLSASLAASDAIKVVRATHSRANIGPELHIRKALHVIVDGVEYILQIDRLFYGYWHYQMFYLSSYFFSRLPLMYF